jgi:hypothetical protein
LAESKRDHRSAKYEIAKGTRGERRGCLFGVELDVSLGLEGADRRVHGMYRRWRVVEVVEETLDDGIGHGSHSVGHKQSLHVTGPMTARISR